MRLGVSSLLPTAEVSAGKAFEWAIEEAAKLEVEIIGGYSEVMFNWDSFPYDRGHWRELRSVSAAYGLAIEPYVRSPFDLVGPGSAQARSSMMDSIRASKELGGPLLRTAYGDNTVSRTRFGSIPLAEHLKLLASNLREAAKLAGSEGVVLAIENHCDFSGREWATVLADVDSKWIRAALDTGNGMALFGDPMADAEALAPWTVTTHIKDVVVVENPRPSPNERVSSQAPFRLAGCPIGEGNVNILAIVQRLIKDCPVHAQVPLIVEPSWPRVASGENLATQRNELLAHSVRNLKQLVQTM